MWGFYFACKWNLATYAFHDTQEASPPPAEQNNKEKMMLKQMSDFCFFCWDVQTVQIKTLKYPLKTFMYQNQKKKRVFRFDPAPKRDFLEFLEEKMLLQIELATLVSLLAFFAIWVTRRSFRAMVGQSDGRSTPFGASFRAIWSLERWFGL